jgi:hypothetical protein
MQNKNLMISLIYLIPLILLISGCKFTGEKITPIFPNFKQTVNTFRAVPKTKPLEFKVDEEGIPFSEIEKRILNKELEPLVCFPISQVQEMRREWENGKNP